MRQPTGPREPADPEIGYVRDPLAEVDSRAGAEVDPAVDARGSANLRLGQLANWRERGKRLAHVRTVPGYEGRFYRPLWDTSDASAIASPRECRAERCPHRRPHDPGRAGP